VSDERHELMVLIREAFDGVERPIELTLHVAEARDDYDYEHDVEHRRRDHEGPWQQILHEHLERCPHALSYLDAVGMRYYLPAFMLWYLEHLGTPRVRSDGTLYCLNPHHRDPELSRAHRERFARFSAEQLRACARFVKFCATHDELTDAPFAEAIYEEHWVAFDA
jgi:hypothetical protein